MSKSQLGEFEELVLTMVGVLDPEAYGNVIVKQIQEQLGRTVNLSAVHITLYRMEDKGLVKSEMGGATSERGGRRKRIFKITAAGFQMLQDLQSQRQKLWEMMPEIKFNFSS